MTTTAPGVNADAACSLEEAIYSANLDSSLLPDPHNPGNLRDTGCASGSGSDTIYLPIGATITLTSVVEGPANYLGPTGTPYVTSTIVIEARGTTMRRAANAVPFRAFSVAEGGDLTLHEIQVSGFVAQGGSGSGGGGGGLGAGGAIYVHEGRLGVGWSTFEGNAAIGGNGSSGNTHGAGGGGGGLGGDGGIGDDDGQDPFDDGGGGGGARGDGGAGINDAPGGGGGTVTSGTTGYPSTGGFDCGGDGADGTAVILDLNGEDADCRGGGGGGAGPGGGSQAPFANGGEGGSGAYGGGGGGGGYPDGDGGNAGFGGGGGSGPAFSFPDGYSGGGGGDGGFGAGGGAGPGGLLAGEPGSAGTFGGAGTDLYGGAGAGLGGAIFGHDADVVVQNSTFFGNSVSHGATSGPSSTRGQDAGGAMFTVGGSLTVANATVSGNASTGDGAGIVVYRSTDSGSSATLRLRNTIIAGNTGHDECFLSNGASDDGSTNNLVTPHVGADIRVACPGITQTEDPALGALQLHAPGLTKTMSIGAGSSALDAADPPTATPDDQRGVLREHGSGPDIGAFESTGAAPETAPETTIALTPASPDGSYGWYVSAVDFAVSATDADSAVAETRCAIDPAADPATFPDLPSGPCVNSTVGGDGSHAVHAASMDTEGNIEIPVALRSFKIDRTDPTLSPTLSSATVVVGHAGVTASPNAGDATSGVGSATCDTVDTSTPGVNTLECTATDKAGNIATASLDYVVEYAILGFFEPAPGSNWLGGQTVPIKVALGDADGTRISDDEAAELVGSCEVTFSVAGVQTRTASCLRYDPATDTFIFNWKLAKRPLGLVTITLTVSYAGTTVTSTLSEQITIAKK